MTEIERHAFASPRGQHIATRPAGKFRDTEQHVAHPAGVEIAQRIGLAGRIDHFYQAALNDKDFDAAHVEALDRIRAAAKAAKPGAWLIVAGGWTEEQFAERRRPIQPELAAAAPGNPVYVQLFYRWAMLTPLALRALNIAGDADLPSGAKLERDADGNPTGGITGGIREFGAIFAKLPAPSDADQVAGTRKFFREMNRLAVTGIVDAGGIGVTPESYQALFKVWRERELTLRVAYSLSAPAPGEDEVKTFQDLTRLLPAGFGDDMLRFAGIGEIVIWGLYNNDHPSEQQKQQFYKLLVDWPYISIYRGESVQYLGANRFAGLRIKEVEGFAFRTELFHAGQLFADVFPPTHHPTPIRSFPAASR